MTAVFRETKDIDWEQHPELQRGVPWSRRCSLQQSKKAIHLSLKEGFSRRLGWEEYTEKTFL
jgi:hypothetical protein